MIAALVFLAPVTLLAMWLFFRSSPKGVEKIRIRLFNAVVIAVGAILSGAVTYKAYAALAGGPDRAWWPVLSVLGSLIVFPASLIVGGLVRHFWAFRSPRDRG